MDHNQDLKYINRELSWLMFNDRVLEEAYDKDSKVFTRLKFLAITASNLDEFFMVRVAGLKQQMAAKYRKKDISGRTPEEQLNAIYIETQLMMKKIYSCLNKSLMPKLEESGIRFKKYSELNERQAVYARDFFDEFCFPALTPLAVDSGRPFPLLQTKGINIGLMLSSTAEEELFAVVKVPTVLPRFVEIHSEEGSTEYIFLEEIILNNLEKLFTGYEIMEKSIFRITRDSDLEMDEDDVEDLLIQIEKNIKRRKWGAAVRLEIQSKGDKKIRKFIKKRLEVKDEETYEINGPLDPTCWFEFIENKKFAHLLDMLPKPQDSIDFFGQEDLFEAIKERDRLLHHPYESFYKVLEFIEQAVEDPKVLAIKQTLYRVSNNSPIISKLISAAENGKQVTVVVELKARFEEEKNILWARKLEQAGCHVVYGLPGLKIHSKALLIVRREEDGIRRYVHLSTGNYNDTTATLYEDLGLFTCREDICIDVSNMFNMITGYTKVVHYKKIFVAPGNLRSGFEYYIDREIRNVKAGGEGHIIAKLNSLIDQGIIDKLYEASREGVKIELIIRGMCGLRAQVQGLSENITVRSIVGTFLEHSRIYYFQNGGDDDLFLSSADWMERNLDRRIEILFPVEDHQLKKRLLGFLDVLLADTEKTRIQLEDGTYKDLDRRGKEPVNAQMLMHQKASEAIKKAKKDMIGL
jgi:polyphosphate kinase